MHLDESLIRLLLLRLEQPGDTTMFVSFDTANDSWEEPLEDFATGKLAGREDRILVCSEVDPDPDVPDITVPADPAFVIKGNLFAAELLAKIYAFTGHGRNCAYRHKGECNCLRNEMAVALDEAGVEYA